MSTIDAAIIKTLVKHIDDEEFTLEKQSGIVKTVEYTDGSEHTIRTVGISGTKPLLGDIIRLAIRDAETGEIRYRDLMVVLLQENGRYMQTIELDFQTYTSEWRNGDGSPGLCIVGDANEYGIYDENTETNPEVGIYRFKNQRFAGLLQMLLTVLNVLHPDATML